MTFLPGHKRRQKSPKQISRVLIHQVSEPCSKNRQLNISQQSVLPDVVHLAGHCSGLAKSCSYVLFGTNLPFVLQWTTLSTSFTFFSPREQGSRILVMPPMTWSLSDLRSFQLCSGKTILYFLMFLYLIEGKVDGGIKILQNARHFP